MVELFANSGDPDQKPRSAASGVGLHCVPVTRLGVSGLQWVNIDVFHKVYFNHLLISIFVLSDSGQTGTEFWIVVGVCIGVIVVEFFVIIGLCSYMQRRSNGQKNTPVTGQINSGFSQAPKTFIQVQ